MDVWPVKEKIVELEVDRLLDTFQTSTDKENDLHRKQIVIETADGLLHKWNEDRKFLQHVLPLLVFEMFDQTLQTLNGEYPLPLERLLKVVVERASVLGCVEFFVRHIAMEFRKFAIVMNSTDKGWPKSTFDRIMFEKYS